MINYISTFYISIQKKISSKMNYSTNNVTTVDIASQLEELADWIGLYAVPYSSGLAFALKLFLLLILSNRSLSNSFYKYLTVKTVFDILVSLVGIAYNNCMCLTCQKYVKNHYWPLLFFVFFERLALRVFMMASFICDIFLAYNRTAIFVPQLKFKDISCIILSIFSFSFSLALFIPAYFSFEIKPLNETGYWSMFLTPIGTSPVFQVYITVIRLFESIVPLAFIIILNCILAYKFEQYLKKRNQLNVTRSQTGTIKVIVISTTLNIIVRLFDTIVNSVFRLVSRSRTDKHGESLLILQSINLAQQISYLFYFINQSIDLFIYLKGDTNISKVFHKVILKHCIYFHYYLSIFI